MKIEKNKILFGVLLVVLSGFIYLVHFFLFHNHHYIIQEHLLGELGFIPIEVLFVSLILHKVIEYQDKKKNLEKINILIGVFYSELGQDLLLYFSKSDSNYKNWISNLKITPTCKENVFKEGLKSVEKHVSDLSLNIAELKLFSQTILEKREMLIRFLENPMLLEHEAFTDLITALFHLTEEFEKRLYLDNLKVNDKKHLLKDMNIVYKLSLVEWIIYLKHLKKEFPDLYLFELDTNPLLRNDFKERLY